MAKTHKWHSPNQTWARRYDEAWTKVRAKLGSYDKIAAELFRETGGQSVVGQTVRRWQKEGTLPVKWATTLVDLMEGEISIFDFFPYLADYVDEGFLE